MSRAKTVNLIKKGIDIVNDHDTMTLRLHRGMGPNGARTIYLTTPTQTYEVTYEKCHYADDVRLTLLHTTKSYLFSDLSQVALYFDIIKR